MFVKGSFFCLRFYMNFSNLQQMRCKVNVQLEFLYVYILEIYIGRIYQVLKTDMLTFRYYIRENDLSDN
jgi:hypothetical protein